MWHRTRATAAPRRAHPPRRSCRCRRMPWSSADWQRGGGLRQLGGRLRLRVAVGRRAELPLHLADLAMGEEVELRLRVRGRGAGDGALAAGLGRRLARRVEQGEQHLGGGAIERAPGRGARVAGRDGLSRRSSSASPTRSCAVASTRDRRSRSLPRPPPSRRCCRCCRSLGEQLAHEVGVRAFLAGRRADGGEERGGLLELLPRARRADESLGERMRGVGAAMETGSGAGWRRRHLRQRAEPGRGHDGGRDHRRCGDRHGGRGLLDRFPSWSPSPAGSASSATARASAWRSASARVWSRRAYPSGSEEAV